MLWSKGTCRPLVACSTPLRTLDIMSAIDWPALSRLVISTRAKGLLPPLPSCETLPGCVEKPSFVALPTVILVLMYGQSRIFFVMARDGLLPAALATVHKTRGTPVLMTAVTGVVVAVMAATLRLDEIALLANAGTLCAFVAVAVSMMVLRVRDPNRPRAFKTPLPWIVGPICVVGCVYLFFNGLPAFTQWWFLLWNAGGLLVYFAYSRRASKLAPQQS